jgi:thiaminase/transcriptional activator TenA
MNRTSFTEDLLDALETEWRRATHHRFTVELGADTLDEAVFRRYLVQDYAFVSVLAGLVGYAAAKAPTMEAKGRFARFLVALTSDENTYFQRSFAALDVAEDDRAAPVLKPVSQAFIALLKEAGEIGAYEDILAVLLPAEWIYLVWAKTQSRRAPSRFYYREWIELHAGPDFEAFVLWLKEELDHYGPRLPEDRQMQVIERFRRMVELEAAFFDTAYEEDPGGAPP